MIISHIVAMAKNNVIGNGLEIPWRIKGEQLRFKELTQGKTIIMGRKTYESIGYPLPNRRTIVITSQDKIEGVETASSIDKALAIAESDNASEVFIAGGGQLYHSTMQAADRIYLTRLDKDIEGDIFYPEVDMSLYEITYEQHVAGDIPYTYYTLERITACK